MDEDTERYATLRPMRHDRFSILIPLFDLVADTIQCGVDAIREYGIMTAQHAAQRQYDRKFERMLK